MVDLGIELSENTLITSKTDLAGKIVYCNKDFVRYSGFKEEEVFGKPHSVVRHSDMPRLVFRTLWEYVKSGKEVFAFVKNATNDGRHYWVFANITPSFDLQKNIVGYYSVRRKPNPRAIEKISSVYDLMRSAEKKSMKESEDILKSILEESKMSYNQLIVEMQGGRL